MTESEPQLDQQPRRRLTMADLGVLVAASAIGLALGRYLDRMIRDPSIAFQVFPGWRRSIVWANAALMAAVFGLLIVRFLPPRPQFREAMRQPGTLALIISVAFWLGYSAIIIGRSLFNNGPGSGPSFAIIALVYMIGSAGSIFTIVWGTLALSGQWHPVTDWVDRAGRGFGVIVILYWLAFSILM